MIQRKSSCYFYVRMLGFEKSFNVMFIQVIKTFANFTDTNNLSYNQENEVIR